MILFVDNNTINWFLSKPDNREIDISDFAFRI